MGFDYERLSNGCFELPKGWSITNVGKVADVNSRTIQKDYDHEWIEYIDIASVERGIINETQHLLLSQAPSRAKRIVRNNDILISSVRPNLEHYVFLKHTKPNMIASTGFVVVSAKDADSRYLYYYLTSKPFTEYLSRIADSHTSAYPSFNPDVIQNAELLLPPHPEQKAIAHVLGTLDDKIELNRRMNETLEAMARAIFKSWFVDFDPVRAKSEGRDTGLPKEISDLFPSSFVDSELGEIPNGWEVGKLGDICKVTIGGDWGKDDFFEDALEVYCLRGVDIDNLRKTGQAEPPIRWIKSSSLEKRKICNKDILIAASGVGPLGRCLWANDKLHTLFNKPVIYANFCKRFEAKTTSHAVYIERILLDMRETDEIWEYSSGTALPNLDHIGLLKGKSIVIPTAKILEQYSKQVSSVVEMLYRNENTILSSMRDDLLPKLISGELAIPTVKELLEDIR